MITCSSVCGVSTGLGGKEYIKIEEHPRQLRNSYIYNLAVYVRDDNKGNGHLKTKKVKSKKFDLKLATGWIQIWSILFQWFLDLRPYRKNSLSYHGEKCKGMHPAYLCTDIIYCG
jgi:hypothetical protein